MWRLAPILVALLLTGCATDYNVSKWQEVMAVPRAEEQRGELPEELARVDRLRDELNLRDSRELALMLAAENPRDPEALWRAARAEADGVFLHHPHEKDQRALAALSAKQYAGEATRLAPEDVHANAWHAWSLGTSIHLAPMFSRAGQANKTWDAAMAALAAEPRNPTANLVMAILNYRLATLPGMVKLMSLGEPESSLADAEEFARASFEEIPSKEAAKVLAQILYARGQTLQAIDLLKQAAERTDRFPRDPEMHDSIRGLLDELQGIDENEK